MPRRGVALLGHQPSEPIIDVRDKTMRTEARKYVSRRCTTALRRARALPSRDKDIDGHECGRMSLCTVCGNPVGRAVICQKHLRSHASVASTLAKKGRVWLLKAAHDYARGSTCFNIEKCSSAVHAGSVLVCACEEKRVWCCDVKEESCRFRRGVSGFVG